MNSILKYRIVAVVLVVVFGVFNIGIPIVVASCPMASMMQANVCGMCYDQIDPGVPRVTTERNTSCCATIIAAERNMNEFVQTKSGVPEVTKMLSVVLIDHVQVSTLLSPVFAVRVSTSPPAVVDIPISVSSLLI